VLQRTTVLSLLVAGAVLVAAGPASAEAPRPAGPVAHASGGDAPPIIPSIVQTRLTRVDNAIGRLTDYVDDNDTAGVDRTGKVIRRQLSAAWRGAKYLVANAPVPDEEAPDPPEGAPVIADPPTSAFAVFESYHSVAATIGQLVDGARVPILNSMSKTLFWTLDARDKAIGQARTFDAPVDPEGEEPEGEAATFATVMPNSIAYFDDEIQQLQGLQADATDLRPGGARILRLALSQTLLSENTVNTYWPVVGED
jgi:hypothetical protein